MSWAVTDHSCTERCLAPPLGYLYCPDLAQNLCATASSVRIDSEKKLNQTYYFIMSKMYFHFVEIGFFKKIWNILKKRNILKHFWKFWKFWKNWSTKLPCRKIIFILSRFVFQKSENNMLSIWNFQKKIPKKNTDISKKTNLDKMKIFFRHGKKIFLIQFFFWVNPNTRCRSTQILSKIRAVQAP